MKKIDYFEDDNIKISMKQKLIVLFLIVGILPLIILGYRAFRDQRIVIKELIVHSSSQIAEGIAEELNEKIVTAHKMLISTSKIPVIYQGKLGEEVDTILRTTVNNFEIFRNLYLIDADGSRGRAAITEDGIETKEIKDIKKIDSNVIKYWYFGSVRGQNSNSGFYSNVYFNKTTGEPLQLMGVIIKNKDELNKIEGLLIAEIRLKEIWSIVDRVKFGKTGFGFVVDNKTGALIAHSNKKVFKPGKIFLSAEKLEEISKLGDGYGGTTYLESKITPKLVSLVKTNKMKPGIIKAQNFFTPDWAIVVEQTENEAFKPARELMIKILLYLFVFSVFSVVLAVFFATGMTRDLKKLHSSAIGISQGDLTQHLNLESSDEIGELARAFDKMRLKLKKKMGDLKTLYEISQHISAVIDYKELLKEIMDIAIKELDAEKGSIMLFDDETDMLKIEASYGLPESVSEDTLINPNKGIVGWVIRTGKPLLIYDTTKEAGFEKMKGRKVESGTLLSAPLKVKGKHIGVINISKSIPNTYKNEDKELFEAIALQGAIAIDKAVLYRKAITDEMTKLYNHRYFQQRFDEELQRAARYGKKVSFLMTDIDHFKSFNDTYGHQVGDRVLKIVAKLLEKSVRDIDIPARYGGEEFAVILPDIDSEGAMVPAERIRRNIEEYDFYVDDEVVPITISIGISNFPEDAKEKPDVIECADNALYYAKETGRNRVAVYSAEIPDKLKELKGKN